jgi:tetratricopeptide (TPR) repeat protein
MQKYITGIIAALTIIMNAPAASAASASLPHCPEKDTDCKTFERLAESQQYEKIVDLYNVGDPYSDESRRLIGDACLALASRDNITPQQEEAYYKGALQVKHYIAYMGLYFSTVQKDEAKAIGYLREYIKTKPADTVPYVILGEYELQKKNYELANSYLQEAKKVAHAHSPGVDWMLFQANYMLKNYPFSKAMFESAITTGKFEKEIKTLSSDPRFDGIDNQPEFSNYRQLFKLTQAHS